MIVPTALVFVHHGSCDFNSVVVRLVRVVTILGSDDLKSMFRSAPTTLKKIEPKFHSAIVIAVIMLMG